MPKIAAMNAEFELYIRRYLDLVPEDQLIDGLTKAGEATMALLENIPEEATLLAYAPGKWTFRELLQHLVDAERIFVYRALRFARNDRTPLPSWDEEPYAAESFANERSWASLLEEFAVQRHSSVLFFSGLKQDAWHRSGIANNQEVGVATLCRLISGHNLHHLDIIKTRYIPLL